MRFLILILLMSGALYGQKKSAYNFENYTYQQNIKSVQTTQGGEPKSIPVLNLNSNAYFVLHFDDLEETEKDYYYKVIHCDKDWQPSNLNEIEYIDGFNDEPLLFWEFSVNTLINYTHYWLNIPNRNTKFKISGNYLIYVYQKDGDKVMPLITRRFIVAENKVDVGSKFVRPTESGELRNKQQMEVVTSIKNHKMINPQAELYMDIIQNGLWQDRVRGIQPRFIVDNIVNFDVFGALSFDGLNEFRAFDTRSVNVVGAGVRAVERKKTGTDIYLYDAKPRTSTVYGFNYDFNGEYYVNNVDFASSLALQQILNAVTGGTVDSLRVQFKSNDILSNGEVAANEKDLRADYCDVYFTLKSPELQGDIYIYGGLTDWQIYPHNIMEYDFATASYTGHMLLKQGYYDYMFAHMPDKGIMKMRDLEGSSENTENNYLIITYSREFGQRYDRVIGYRFLNTLNEAYFKN